MAWRFKASKYKNAAPIVPKLEHQIRGLSIGDYRGRGNFITASAAFAAFNWEAHGSSVAVLPLSTKGRVNKASIPLLHAHADVVTDLCFSPFDDGLLATGSQDLTIKLWRIPESGLESGAGASSPELVLPEQPRRVECLAFNPSADSILASSSGEALTVWDLVDGGAEVFNSFGDHTDEIHSLAWNRNGSLLATQCKDRMLRVLDPRQKEVVAECDSHQGIKDSKVVWVDGDRLLTSGFSADRFRELYIRDLRNLKDAQTNLKLDMSSGILVPLFDPDTNMCFLCGKGDRTIQFVEVTNRDPFFVEGLKFSGDQTRGTCLVPKRAMDVMTGEVNRILQLCSETIVPITWQVPRKSYREYHSDIFPDTVGLKAAIGPEDWRNGGVKDPIPAKISLDPKKRPKDPLTVFQEVKLTERPRVFANPSGNGEDHAGKTDASKNGDTTEETNSLSSPVGKPVPKPRISPRSSTPSSKIFAAPAPKEKPVAQVKPTVSPKPISVTNVKANPASAPVPRPAVESPNKGVMNVSDYDSSDVKDEGLAVLRRRPSIRDRKKLLEQNMKKTNGDGSASRPLATHSRTPSDEDSNKENKIKAAEVKSTAETAAAPPTQAAPKAASVTRGGEGSVELRKKNPFLVNDGKRAESMAVAAPAKRPVSQRVFGRISKFKHLKGEVILKGRFENLKNLSRVCPAECDFVHANEDHIAVPLTGPGGKLAIFETRRPGRITDGVMPAVINGATLMDFSFSPHDSSLLACAADDGIVRLWRIPQEGLGRQVSEPATQFLAHSDKIQILRFHPLASNVVLTAAFDRTVKLWNLNNTAEPMIELEGHEDQLFSARFSQCGRFVATLCRDGKIRIFDPRKSTSALVEGGQIVPKKGARVVWVLDGEYLVVTGFSRQSERQVMVYRTEDLSMVHSETLDVSPAILIPHYDEDSNTLFLTGKGEGTVTTFEVSTDKPHLFPLSPYKPGGLHQGFAFLHKNVCDVRAVEFCRSYRLTDTSIEPVAFSVPRVRTAFFQDDLFPPTRMLWEAALSTEEWFAGEDRNAPRISLQPEDMQALSGSTANKASTTSNKPAAPPSSAPPAAAVATSSLDREDAKKREADIENSVSSAVAVSSKLEQDDMDGVDDKEWEEDE